jgi:uncharacterized phage protein gp47/JayE
LAITDFTFFKPQDQILAEMLAQLTAAIPDAHTDEDGLFAIIFNVEAGQLETVYLANQLLLEDMFITTASQQALQRHGEEYGVPMKDGTYSTGTLMFTGDGATYVPVGTEVGYDPGNGLDVVYFNTTSDGTIPNPGTPTAPTAADAGAGTMAAGLYEFAVSFQTASGETLIGPASNALSIALNHNITVSNIPVGGAGTTARNLYMRINGGAWQKVITAAVVTALNNNTTTSVTISGGGSYAGSEPQIDTAHSVTVNGIAQETGVIGNTAIGTVTVLTNAPASLTAVTNPTAFAGGSDPEDTDTYRQRLLQWVQNPQTGSAADLKSWAEAVAGVESATVFPNTPTAGEVTIRISGPGGTVPDSTVINNVLAALQIQDLANVILHVASFTPVSTNVTVDVTTSGTYTLTDVTVSVQQAISAYINSLPVGGTLYLAGIVDAVFGLAGIADVVVTTPATNQTTAADSKRTPGTITVT